MKRRTFQMILLAAALFVMGCNSTSGNPGEDRITQKNQEPALKRYELRSGIVHYTVKITGEIMGGNVQGNGVRHLYFKDWGALELREEESTQTTEINVYPITNFYIDTFDFIFIVVQCLSQVSCI